MSTIADEQIGTVIEIGRIRAEVDSVLIEFIDQQRCRATLPEMGLFIDVLEQYTTAGGKRLRPIMCIAGWYAVSDRAAPRSVFLMAAAIELFHSFALIHDDVMDRSDRRRGQLTAHRMFEQMFADHPDSETLGLNAAILLGDLVLGWSYEILWEAVAHIPQQYPAVGAALSAMHTETLIGQYLDLLAAGSPTPDPATAWRIIGLKTAKYSIERPLHVGALLAGADRRQLGALSRYAKPVGEALQLRDDLLGVFGDPVVTGKPACDDIVEGKNTVLLALALQHATPEQAQILTSAMADARPVTAHIEAAKAVLVETGAVAEVEALIEQRRSQAGQIVDRAPLRPPARDLLRRLADQISIRTA
ncbi:polyprenyl synthetase family protein [Nocardia brasiliensis]